MRTLYLIRHAMPDIPLGERWCVGGRSDFPLGAIGRLQAALLPFAPELRDVTAVYCSALTRARQTAAALCAAPTVVPGLEEQDMGEWDGLSFAAIREKFPALYTAREKDPTLMPAGAENESEVRARMETALRRILAESEGELAAVSHKGAIASLLGSREGLEYTSLTRLRFEGERLLSFELLGAPRPALTDEVCEALLSAAGADEALRAHCRAVAALADELGEALREKGAPLDADALHAAALLHDIARGEPDHAARGARRLGALGYPGIAEIVRQHHELESAALDEAAVVYLADKAVRGARRVPINERFAASAAKCTTPEAIEAHARRYAAAKKWRDEINRLCGAELIR